MMFTKRQLLIATPLVGFLALLLPTALRAQQEPALPTIAAKGRATLDSLETKPAFWSTAFELPGGVEAHVDVTSVPPMRLIEMSFQRGRQVDRLFRIVERDQFWYLSNQLGHFKYRPYEAPTVLPAAYVYLGRSDPRVIIDDETDLGVFVDLQGSVATYRSPLSEAIRQNLQASLDGFLELEKSRPDKIDDKTKQTKSQIEQMLENGTEAKVDIENGILQQFGGPGQRCWVREFRWLNESDPKTFDVSSQQWTDHSASLLEDPATRKNVTMIGNAPLWKPGQPAGDTELLLLNIETGQTRRLPYEMGIASNGCFSKDRSRVYISGQVPDLGSMVIFELDLLTGEHRQLGGPELEAGITMFPSLSPDAKHLAVIHTDQAAGLLKSQIFLIEVESGSSRPIGEPFDTAHVSWLPDGKGLVLVSRENRSLDEPPINTICRMDLEGNLVEICKGAFPVVLHPDSRILFKDQDDDLWKICDLEGKDVRLLGDGMKSFGFPSASPDGQQLLMMKFGGAKGPQPHVVDIAKGTTKALDVGPGLWTRAAWR